MKSEIITHMGFWYETTILGVSSLESVHRIIFENGSIYKKEPEHNLDILHGPNTYSFIGENSDECVQKYIEMDEFPDGYGNMKQISLGFFKLC